VVKLCLTGDVMSGRGIDQILRHTGDPRICERWMSSALGYVALAERRSGPIPRRVGPEYVWGDALEVLRAERPDALVVNLETAVTDRGRPWPGKGIQYRMHPANVELLTAAGVDVAVLANNHVLDWSEPGLDQTLEVLDTAGIASVGAGRDRAGAWRAAVRQAPAAARVVVVAAGTASSGIPWDWAADEGRPGVAFLAELSDRAVERIAAVVASAVIGGDVVVVSLHWGPNWGYAIPPEHRRFARALIDRAGAHVVHGHSSHHPLGIEVHRGRLILYGCGDLITDYEGIGGHERYRGELGALYLATVDPGTGLLQGLDLVPTKLERFRLNHPAGQDLEWLAAVLQREGASLGTTVAAVDGRLSLRW
jgi:poly-gamma-glutamate synthesis protein (capsule biosynthesis protein)